MEPTIEHALDWIASQHDSMLQRTVTLANINSGSLNPAGVTRVRQTLAAYCHCLGGEQAVIALQPFKQVDHHGELREYPIADALRIRKHPQAPLQVFLGGHMDTVFAIDHPFQTVTQVDDNTLNGPGVADLKGGLIVMLTALEALERSPFAGNIGWELLFNPDEEIGSLSSAHLLTEAASRCHLGLIYEPCLANGNLAGDRKGSGNFSLVVKGRAAHAGREHALGRNAIRALCDTVSAIDALNGQRDGITINPGFIHGGGAVNVVPDNAMARINIRLQRESDAAWCQDKLNTLVAEVNRRDGIELFLHGGFGRMPKLLNDAHLALYSLVRECGQHLDLDLSWQPTGGCCDGNNLSAAGLPNIDTLGVQGGNIHSADEYMKIDSLSARAKLNALLLMRLAQGRLNHSLGCRALVVPDSRNPST